MGYGSTRCWYERWWIWCSESRHVYLMTILPHRAATVRATDPQIGGYHAADPSITHHRRARAVGAEQGKAAL